MLEIDAKREAVTKAKAAGLTDADLLGTGGTMIQAPKTQAEADALRYNKRAGHPQGTRYDATRCAYEVWDRGRGYMSWQCSRKRGHGPDGLYCKMHAKMVMPNDQAHLSPPDSDGGAQKGQPK